MSSLAQKANTPSSAMVRQFWSQHNYDNLERLRMLDPAGKLVLDVPVGQTNGSLYCAAAGFDSKGKVALKAEAAVAS